MSEEKSEGHRQNTQCSAGVKKERKLEDSKHVK